MELQRQLGVTYKCAWRIGNRIRAHIKDENVKLKGTVECDEAYVGGKRRLAVRGRSSKNKTPVFGIVERGGKVHAEAVPDTSSYSLFPIIKKHVQRRSKVITDSFGTYKSLKWEKPKYDHRSVNHSKWEYVRKEGRLSINTNTIEGFWSGLKGQLNGTHRFVGKRYLSNYLNEVVFRYNHRGKVLFPLLLEKVLT